jgi:hypothetical protein
MERRNPADFTVSRQMRWHQEGRLVVEVTAGGSDFTGPDQLSTGYTDEGKTFQGQAAALEVAIRIAERWQLDQPNKRICVDVGDNGGGIVNLDESVLITDKEGLARLQETADSFDSRLERCEQCASFLPDKRERYKHHFVDECVYCSERCANLAYEAELTFHGIEDVDLV